MDGPYRIREGMEVLGPTGEKVGTVGQVVVGTSSREARFFTIEKGLVLEREHLVPREAVTHVDVTGRAHVALAADAIERLPEYDGDAPTREEAEEAFRVLREATPPPRVAGRSHVLTEPAYEPRVEPFAVLEPRERERQGFRTEWTRDAPRPGDEDAE